jgi:large subunit ribosomal protein L18
VCNRKKEAKLRRRKRIRKKIFGTEEIPRLSVFRSLKHIYAQLIDDQRGITLASASSLGMNSKLRKIERAREVGHLIAERAKSIGVRKVRFDRGGNLYHGRVKALAEGARENGLEF